MSGGSHVVSANIGTAAGEGWEPVGTGNFSSRIFQTFQWGMNAPISYQAPAGCTINNAAATGGFWTPARYGGVYCLNPFGGACRYVANGISADRQSIFCDFDMLYHDNYGACNFATDLACTP
jgi:hypothetical protein